MTQFQFYAVLISVMTAIVGAAGIYYVTQWLDRREKDRSHSPAE
jgi:hypothetical protein